jgi:hypothetical protein
MPYIPFLNCFGNTFLPSHIPPMPKILTWYLKPISAHTHKSTVKAFTCWDLMFRGVRFK